MIKLRYTILLLSVIFLTSCTKDKEDTHDVNNTSETNTTQNTAQEQIDIEIQLFNLINNHRESINLQSLAFEDNTYIQAIKHTDYMIFQGHTSHAKFGERAKEIAEKTGAKEIAENVAKDYPTIQRALEAWLESPGHKKNIEGDYTHSALSIKEDTKGNKYFTQIFYK